MNRGALILAAVCAFGPAAGFAQDESKTPKKTFQVAGFVSAPISNGTSVHGGLLRKDFAYAISA